MAKDFPVGYPQIIPGMADIKDPAIHAVLAEVFRSVEFLRTQCADVINDNVGQSFLAYTTAAQDNVTGNGTVYKVLWEAATFDKASGFDAANDKYVVSKAGKYLFGANLQLAGIVAGHAGCLLNLDVGGVNHRLASISAESADYGGVLDIGGTVLLDLSAADEVIAELTISGGTLVVDITAGTGVSYLWGTMVA